MGNCLSKFLDVNFHHQGVNVEMKYEIEILTPVNDRFPPQSFDLEIKKFKS